MAAPGGPAASEAGLDLMDQGRFGEAVACFEQALLGCPDDARTQLNLGVAHLQLGAFAPAALCFERALALRPDYAKAHLNLGTALLGLNRWPEAATAFEQALARAPDLAEAALNLGIALERQGRLDDAAARWRQLLGHRPDCVEAHLNLGVALMEQGQITQARTCLERALALRPGSAEAHMTLGVLLRRQNRLGEAIGRFQRTLVLTPDWAEAWFNLGSALQEQGRLDEALEAFDRALTLKPDLVRARQARMFTQLYQPGTTLATIAAAAEDWNHTVAAPLKPDWPQHDPQSRPERPRLGFVSGDFRSHAVGFLVLPTLEALARAGHRFHCYANQAEEDAVTRRFRAAALVWRPVFGRSDAEVAALIEADGIDILFDLSGCSALNRLAVFARKPAPVQVAWVGYPATTGLDAMDYLLADPVQVPPGAEIWYRERVVRMPDSYVLYQPLEPAPEITALPASRTGTITFGSFNVLKKITPEGIAVWCRLLHRVPKSRLLIKAAALDCPETRRLYVERFAVYGITPDRLTLVGGSSPAVHRQTIAEVDIALDSFPYSGGLTTLECLWMGVPVVTYSTDTLCGRHSLGYLSVIGLSELATESIDGYLDIATGLAGDPDRLSALRAGLRQRIQASPLSHTDRFVRHFEQALTRMWARFRAGEPARGFDVTPDNIIPADGEP